MLRDESLCSASARKISIFCFYLGEAYGILTFTIQEICRLQDSATVIFTEESPRAAAGKIMKRYLGNWHRKKERKHPQV